ncbi:MAG: hypothetical protein Kow0010_27270 [Dehalococcoidia bacterium]
MRGAVVARKALRDMRTAALAVGAVNVLMAALVIGLYPEFKDMLGDLEELPPIYQAFLGQAGGYDTPEGFIAAEFFSWIPLLIITVAIIGGTGALAGEESAGTMDLLLAQPIARWRLVVEKALGITVALVAMALVALPGFVAMLPFFDTDISVWKLALATAGMVPLGLLYLGLSLWAAAALPTRTSAVVAVVGLAVAAYILHTLGAVVPWLDTARKFQPFYWADGSRPLVEGLSAAWAGWNVLLLTLATGTLACAVYSFERRDIASGAREWGLRQALAAIGARTPAAKTEAKGLET